MSTLMERPMAKGQKKNREDGEVALFLGEFPKEKPAEKFTAQVKFTADFQSKLADIAAYASRSVGREVPQAEIIERKLAWWVKLTHLVVMRQKLADAEAEARVGSGNDTVSDID